MNQTASAAPALPTPQVQPTLPVRPVQPAGPVHGVPYHGGVTLQATPPSVRYSAPGTPTPAVAPVTTYTSATVPSPSTQPAAFQPQGQVRPIAPPPQQPSGYVSAEQQALPLRGFDTRETAEVGSGVAQPTAAQRQTVQGAAAAPGEVAATAWTTPSTAPTVAPAAAATTGGPTSRYGYLPDYSQLSGRLEYEQATGRWKLRYIPHDAPQSRIDDFGGSVVLANTGQLSNLRAGDYVRVAGRIGGDDTTSADFAPTYQVAQVIPVN